MLMILRSKPSAANGMTPEQAIYQACVLRFAILMTTMAAMLGAVPHAGHRRRLGDQAAARYAIVGGLALSHS